MPRKAKNNVDQASEPVYKQSQSPWEDPDTPVSDPNSSIPRPLTFEEMVYTPKVKKAPRFDMDSDLGA